MIFFNVYSAIVILLCSGQNVYPTKRKLLIQLVQPPVRVRRYSNRERQYKSGQQCGPWASIISMKESSRFLERTLFDPRSVDT